jgi:hypothetical protein
VTDPEGLLAPTIITFDQACAEVFATLAALVEQYPDAPPSVEALRDATSSFAPEHLEAAMMGLMAASSVTGLTSEFWRIMSKGSERAESTEDESLSTGDSPQGMDEAAVDAGDPLSIPDNLLSVMNAVLHPDSGTQPGGQDG